ncbi:hypothetical protein NIIDMKKI_07060 [Mycobacterium kansasii]|uniref:Uncharacterized protein n=1 Tax=Mycobacterium kansasii TaxID=1768 RepID=A0A7G1I3A1_MYCKA|nr:hypothetical protein NIIDMKKI_07060 [Mycobacterium kansasii]
MTASGSTLRTSTNPAARAASLTGGTPGPDGTVVPTGRTGKDVGAPTPGSWQAPETATSNTATTAAQNRRIPGIRTLSRVVQP